MSVLSIVAYVYLKNSGAMLRLSHVLMERVRDHVAAEAAAMIRPAGSILGIGADLATQAGFSLPANPTLRTYALGVLEVYGGVHAVLLADAAGNFMMATRSAGGVPAVKTIEAIGAGPRASWEARGPDGLWRPIPAPDRGGYDPRTRPWYLGARERSGVFWSDVYMFHTDRVPGITASRRVLDEKGAFLGVIGIDVKLGQLSGFLGRLEVGRTGLALIVNKKGEVVAYPGGASTVDPKSGKHVLPTMDQLGRPHLASFVRALEQTGDRELVFNHDGRRYLGTMADFPADFAKDWRIALVAPEDDFIGPLKQTGYESLAFTGLVLVVSLCLGALLAGGIARPIGLLIAETRKIRRLELDGQVDIRTHIKEIEQMKDAFSAMKASLASFTKFAPEEVVRQVVGRGEQAMLAGEKREVTVLFCDLRGFTGFAEKTGAEEVVNILNAHFDVMVRIISEHRGFVCDFLGDSVFAVFGAPSADPEHARHAVDCALRMQQARRRLDRETAPAGMPPLEMGIGINSGACVVGNMGSQMRIKYGVVGSAVNLGARIESFSVGGQVLISRATRAAVEGHYELVGPHAVRGKGVEEPIDLWEVRASLEDPELALPPTVSGLAPLARPLAVELRLLSGKAVEPETYPAEALALGRDGLELGSDLELPMFAAIQILLPAPEGGRLAVDARVAARPGPGRAVARFSGLDPAAAEVIARLVEELTAGA